jgi:DNA-binding transcriptional ArsR family regulator
MPDRPPPRAAVTGVMAARRALLALADRLLPAHFALFDKTIGLGRTHVLGTLAELRVADVLAERPQTAEELAARLDVHADTLHRVLRAAAVEGLVKIDRRGRFKLARLGEPLRSDSPHSLNDWARYLASPATAQAWADLTESVRTGESAFPRVHGMSVWQWLAEHPDEERAFAGGMRRITEELAPAIVAGYDWPAGGVVCDVAGGVGTLLAAILRDRPDLRGVLVDGPGVLTEADTWLSSIGLRDRVELREGNIFEKVEAEAHVYLLKDVLHDWGDPACAQILATVRATMPAGSRLILVEDLQERNKPSATASLTDLQMLTQCDDGRQRSADELKRLLEGAGLRPGAVNLTSGPALVEGLA